MKNPKKATVWFFFISLFAAITGYVLTSSVRFGICVCTPNICDPICVLSYARIGTPLLFGMGALAIIFLILLLVPKAARAWNKFGVWSVPLMAAIFVMYPTTYGAEAYIFPDPEIAFKYLGAFYILVSLAIIVFAARKKG